MAEGVYTVKNNEVNRDSYLDTSQQVKIRIPVHFVIFYSVAVGERGPKKKIFFFSSSKIQKINTMAKNIHLEKYFQKGVWQREWINF